MHLILWRFRPQRGCEAAFEEAYRASGPWAKLFSRSTGYLGTELLRSEDGFYVVVDRWASRISFDEFQKTFLHDYRALDEACAALTSEETPLGRFSLVE